jgi:hypothetical protein
MTKSLDQINDDFSRIWANSQPVRSKDELDAAIRAAGLDYDQVNTQWLRSLKKAWVYLDSDAPFDDENTNRAYRRELMA